MKDCWDILRTPSNGNPRKVLSVANNSLLWIHSDPSRPNWWRLTKFQNFGQISQSQPNFTILEYLELGLFRNFAMFSSSCQIGYPSSSCQNGCLIFFCRHVGHLVHLHVSRHVLCTSMSAAMSATMSATAISSRRFVRSLGRWQNGNPKVWFTDLRTDRQTDRGRC